MMADKHGGSSESGEGITRRGENMVKHEGQESGRQHQGTKGASKRPVGTSTSRGATSVNPARRKK